MLEEIIILLIVKVNEVVRFPVSICIVIVIEDGSMIMRVCHWTQGSEMVEVMIVTMLLMGLMAACFLLTILGHWL